MISHLVLAVSKIINPVRVCLRLTSGTFVRNSNFLMSAVLFYF